MKKNKQKLPDGWKVKKIQEIGQVVAGSTPSTKNQNYWNGDISWFTPADLSKIKVKNVDDSSRKITNEGLNSCSASLVPANSLIVSTRAPIGYIVINNKPASTNQGCKSVVINDPKDIDINFLYYNLTYRVKDLIRLGCGSTFLELGKKDFEKFKVTFPNLSQQKKIAAILSTVDDEITKTDEIITETELLKKGLMQQLFSKGIGHTKFKKTKLGMIPEEWEISTTGKLCRSIVPGRNKPKTFDGDIAWVTIPDIIDEEIRYKKAKKTTKDELDEAGNKIVPKNSVIMSCVGKLGVVAVSKIGISLNQQLHAFIPKKCINPYYLKYYLIHNKKLLENLATKTTVLYLNKTGCESVPVLLPSINEQKEIVSILSSVDDKIRINQKIKKQLLQLKKGLMQDLLSGRKLMN